MSGHERLVPRPLAWLSDVDLTGLTDGYSLIWDATAKKWTAGRGEPLTLFQQDHFIAAGVGDTLTLGTEPQANSLLIWLNGHLLYETTDYTLTDNIVTFIASYTGGDIVHTYYAYAGASSAATLSFGTQADNFNRVDSSTAINPASDGGLWTPNTPSSVWGIHTNRAYLVSSSATGLANNQDLLRTNKGTVAATVTVDNIRANTSNSSAVWASFDPTAHTGYMALFDSSSGFGGLYKVNGASFTLLTSVTFTTWTGSSATLQFIHNGVGNLTIKQGGTTKATYADGSPLTGTWVGISQNVGNVGTVYDHWDNFTVV